MKIEFLSLKAVHHEVKRELSDAIARVVESGSYILGEEVDAFEDSFARYNDAQHAVGVGNGLDALKLGLLAIGVQAGHEVLVPSNTFIASWLAITQIGAVPVPVEPNVGTMNIDTRQLSSFITPKTKAIMPVHLYGEPVNLEEINGFAKENRIKVIEDAAQAHGAQFRGKKLGSHSDVVAWSFYPAKNLGAMGDGGAITTDDSEIADRVRLLRNYGSRRKYANEEIGFNSRLDPIQAAILRVKLSRLDSWNGKRRSVASRYIDDLSSLEIELPKVSNIHDSAWHLFVVRVEDRDRLRQQLLSMGIETGVHYPIPPHLQPAYSHLGYRKGDFPVAEQISERCLSLPMGPHLNDDMVAYVCEGLRKCLG